MLRFPEHPRGGSYTCLQGDPRAEILLCRWPGDTGFPSPRPTLWMASLRSACTFPAAVKIVLTQKTPWAQQARPMQQGRPGLRGGLGSVVRVGRQLCGTSSLEMRSYRGLRAYLEHHLWTSRAVLSWRGPPASSSAPLSLSFRSPPDTRLEEPAESQQFLLSWVGMGVRVLQSSFCLAYTLMNPSPKLDWPWRKAKTGWSHKFSATIRFHRERESKISVQLVVSHICAKGESFSIYDFFSYNC